MKRSNETSEKDPFISIIIPAYNREEGLKDTLDSAINQTYPKEHYEVLVVDNMSTDGTLEVIKKYEDTYPNLVKGLTQEKIQGVSPTRNEGIRNAEGDVFVFIDADMWAEENWLEVIAEEFKKGTKYLGYDVEIVEEEENLFSDFNKYNGFRIEEYIKDRNYSGTGCTAVAREVIEDVGMFDIRLDFSEDKEFGNRVHENGYKIKYTENTKVYHEARDSFSSLLRKYFSIGRGHCQLANSYPNRYQELKRSIFNFIHLLPDPPDILKRSVYPKIGIKMFEFFLLKWIFKIATHIGYAYEKGRI